MMADLKYYPESLRVGLVLPAFAGGEPNEACRFQ
jgi:hypothetical protein